ncbi:ABC transporter permease [Dactylosporangium sucinum]|uniref:Polysaccharide ABC transporter ATP-binding protein n=1 Tax=Dactylosporangium sucinum TaxID=1424081 RepID=A0A917UA33_9ACTN|nr:ABC transporter permease subunit [Dactylosporangium sucinum]GGM69909.1 polysaccharide ABC transporter ATP-binding protein [Dactylosporangium sucinum]
MTQTQRPTATPPPVPDPAAGPRRREPSPRPKRYRLSRDRVLLLATAPGLAVLLTFHYLPLLGNVIAFQDFQPYLGILHSPWNGLANFEVLTTGDPQFVTALGNTLVIMLLQIGVVFTVPIALALLLDSLVSERWKRVVQTVLYLPHFLSWVIVVSIFNELLGGSGPLNTFLRRHDLGTVDIVGNAAVFQELITGQVLWKEAGWAMILFLAALSRIDPELYEASAVDGAGKARQLWHITLPGLRSVIVLLLILRLGDALTVGFEQILLQQQAVGVDASEVLDTYVYNHGIVMGDWGVSAAVGLVKGLVGVVLVLGANKLAHVFGEPGLYQRSPR